MQRSYSSYASRSVTSISSLRTYSLDSKRSSALSLYQRSRFQRFVRAVQGVFGKAKLKTRGKRLNSERLKHVQDRLADMKYELASDHDSVTANHIVNYAPLYVLKLISVIFADDQACLKLEKANRMTWGIRSRETAEWISLATVRDKYKDNVRRPLASLSGDRLSPKAFLARATHECWRAITAGEKGPESQERTLKALVNRAIGSTADNRFARQDARWFLRCFCVIYGFAAVKLQVPNNLMAAQLTQIASLPFMAEYLQKNEDTLYALELGYTYMEQSQHRMAEKQSVITLQEPVDNLASAPHAPSLGRQSLARLNRHPHLSFLYPTPVPTVYPAVLTDPSAAPEGPDSTKPSVDASLTVGTEIVVMHLMEVLTRSCITAGLTPATIANVIQNLPRMLQSPPPMELVDELQASIDYLLSPDIPEASLKYASHWFRESADHRKLRLLNEVGLTQYFERTAEADKPNAVSHEAAASATMPPPQIPVRRTSLAPQRASIARSHTLSDSCPTIHVARLISSADPSGIPLTAQLTHPTLGSTLAPGPAAVAGQAALTAGSNDSSWGPHTQYAIHCRSYDFGCQGLRQAIVSQPRRVSRATNDTELTEESEVTRVTPLDDDGWKLPLSTHPLPPSPSYAAVANTATTTPATRLAAVAAITPSARKASSSTTSVASTASSVTAARHVLNNITLVASHIKYCIQQLPDGLIPDS
ncbi:hypothetical protein H4R35_007130, partial [Dimargaris xerosporica]